MKLSPTQKRLTAVCWCITLLGLYPILLMFERWQNDYEITGFLFEGSVYYQLLTLFIVVHISMMYLTYRSRKKRSALRAAGHEKSKDTGCGCLLFMIPLMIVFWIVLVKTGNTSGKIGQLQDFFFLRTLTFFGGFLYRFATINPEKSKDLVQITDTSTGHHINSKYNDNLDENVVNSKWTDWNK